MDELVRWLGEQLDEDERIARAAAKKVSAPPNDGARWSRDWDSVHTAPSDPPGHRRKVADCGHGGWDLTAHVAAHDPARVLLEIDAKRQLLALHTEGSSDLFCAHCEHEPPCPTLRLLALPYADRPGYREEWRP